MNFYQSVFLEKNFLANIRKKVGFGGNYPLIFTLSDQSYDSKNYFKKSFSMSVNGKMMSSRDLCCPLY